MTTKEMMATTCPPGYWFVNTAAVDAAPDWQLRVRPHDSKLIFGYEPDVLIAKQYQRSYPKQS